MNLDQRNSDGYPIGIAEPAESRLERAKQLAAEARERNTPPCRCEACRQMAMLPAVQAITQSWNRS